VNLLKKFAGPCLPDGNPPDGIDKTIITYKNEKNASNMVIINEEPKKY
jgi:hypothetical protein